MNTRPYFLLLAFIIVSISGYSQNQTFISFETGITNDIYEIFDDGNRINPIPLISPFNGVNIEQEITDNLLISTGVSRKKYNDGFGFNPDRIYIPRVTGFSTHAFNTWQIPLRLKSKVTIFKKIHILPTIGYNLCIIEDSGNSGAGHFSAGGFATDFTYQGNNLKTYSLLETAFDIEFNIFKNISLSVNSSFLKGFKSIMDYDIEYTYDNEELVQAKAHIKGDYWKFTIELKYPLSNLWIDKNEKIE